ncbi:hypothetical protein J0X19_10345 [Hymenobacter sp. BT186]|uniref:DUF3575 domain-containing protein n=1 Tax=Hymenobacter telluris TaxID=2816474 RepID=A0A939J918_9BACT|nr:hypothetical protein [Hymenobacter telluris]MBO0358344.1 hypothetical protein [Hymenobacter telluris]MBW3374370.1 hypothetical protein [Hymenobacter norwichensis]
MAVLLSVVSLFQGQAHAQTTPSQDQPARPEYHNAVRLDVGGILARNVAYNALNNNPQMLLPLLFGYERQLGPRVSGNAEVLLNGGEPEERLSGVALQGRYYYFQGRKTGLNGFYVAPTVSYRAVRQLYYYGTSQERRKLGGAGMLLGAQVPLGSRLLLDVSGGVMTWGRLDRQSTDEAASGAYHYDNKTFYERNKSVFDGRLSLGYRF